MKLTNYLLPVCFLLCSCAHLGKDYDSLTSEVSSEEAKRTSASQQYVTGTVDALGRVPEAERTPEIILAEELAKDAQIILGLPKPGDRIDITPLLSHDEKVRAAAWKVLEKKKKEDKETAIKLEELNKQLAETEAKLVELGKVKEKEDNSNLLKKVFRWATGTFGLLGGIAFIVLCPTLALPLLGMLLRLIVSLIPKLMSFIGVVGADVFRGVVSGIESMKEKLDKAPADKTYTKAEVDTMIHESLGRSMDASHKKIVKEVRTKINVRKVKANS